MSRDNYQECEDDAEYYEHLKRLREAAKSYEGKAYFRSLVDALEAQPKKALADYVLVDCTGMTCAVGSVLKHKGKDVKTLQRTLAGLDEEEVEELINDGELDDVVATGLMENSSEVVETIANELDVPQLLICETQYRNDQGHYTETPEQRYERMLKWAKEHL